MAFIQSWSLFKRCVYSNLLYIQIDWPFIQIGRLSKFVIYSMWLFIPICCLFELVGYVNWMVVYSNWSLIQICCLFKFGVYSNLWCTRFGCLFKFGVYSNLVLIQLRCFSKLSFIQILLFIFKLLHIQICPYIQIGSCSPIAVPVHRSHAPPKPNHSQWSRGEYIDIQCAHIFALSTYQNHSEMCQNTFLECTGPW